MKNYISNIHEHTIAKLGITVAVSYVFYILGAFLFPVFLAIGLAFALHPLTNLFAKISFGKQGWHASRVVAILLAFCVLGVFLFFVGSTVVFPLFGQINELLAKMPEYSSRVHNSEQLGWILGGDANSALPSTLNALVADGLDWLFNFVQDIMKNLFQSTLAIVVNMLGLIVVPFLSFYFLKDWRDLKAMAINAFPKRNREKVEHIIESLGVALSSYFMGLWKVALISGSAVGIALMVFGVKYVLVFAFFASLSELIPIVGPILAAIPAIFITYREDPQVAMYLLIFYIVYYTFNSKVIIPEVMGKKLDLHPVIIVVALFVGAKLFGLMGMVFAVPIAAVYRVFYKELWHYKGEEDNNKSIEQI